jgi:hypothetical protein
MRKRIETRRTPINNPPDTSIQFSRKRNEFGGHNKFCAALSEKSLGDRRTPSSLFTLHALPV